MGHAITIMITYKCISEQFRLVQLILHVTYWSLFSLLVYDNVMH